MVENRTFSWVSRRIGQAKQILRGLGRSYSDLCTVCEEFVTYRHTHTSIRESYQCPNCRASLRYREQARVLIDLFAGQGVKSLKSLVRIPAFTNLSIYEPGISGPFRAYLSTLPSYTNSFYWEDVPSGEFRDGVRCENLMQLSLLDSSLDLIITSDVFEHVRHPMLGFGEIRRVLKPGGYHVFSIPLMTPAPLQTHYRVDTSRSHDLYIDPPHYHGDGAGGRSLVYTEFGLDLLAQLQTMGLKTFAVEAHGQGVGLERLLTFYSIKQPEAEGFERASSYACSD